MLTKGLCRDKPPSRPALRRTLQRGHSPAGEECQVRGWWLSRETF